MSTLATASPELLKPLRTWSSLASARKAPSEYEIVSVNTIFRANERDKVEMSTNVPMNVWMREHFSDGKLQHEDWNAFRDPDAITYRAYCSERDRDEVYVDGLLSQYAEQGHDAKLSTAWVDQLAALYAPLRFLLHASQMSAAYQVVMSPASTITNCLTFQMGDQFRWVSRVAYRTSELHKARPHHGFGAQERSRWERAPEWQGFRELMERQLIAYDWGTSFFALNLVAMPAIDVAIGLLKEGAIANGDGLTQHLVDAQLKDSSRRNRWMKRFMEFIASKEQNVAFAGEVVGRWTPLAHQAVYFFAEALETGRGNVAKAALDAAKKFY
jgi:toluene monooxygenase system protein E